MAITRKEFFEFSDENWKTRVFNYLHDKKGTETPAYNLREISRDLSTFDSKLPDTKRKVEWALEELISEGKIQRTRIKLNDVYYYMFE